MPRCGRMRPCPPPTTSSSAPARPAACSPHRLTEDPGASACCCSRPAARTATRTSRSRPRSPSSSSTKLDWDLQHRARAPLRRALALHPARQGPRRLELDERDALRPRPAARLRPVGGRRAPPAGAGTTCCPYFLRAEDNERGASEHHAVGGPLHVADERSPRPLTRALPRPPPRPPASRASPTTTGPSRTARALVQVTQRNGRRWSTADAYLRPALKPPEPRGRAPARTCSASSFDGDRAVGRALPRPARARAGRAAPSARSSSAAGAIGSPQLLMLSGIGPADAPARGRRRRSRHDLPGVGENLQDHPYVVVHLGGRRRRLALRRRQAQAAARVAAAPQRAADLDGRRGVRVRPHAGRACRRPTSSSTSRPAYFDDHGFDEYDGHAFTLRAGARHAARAAGTCACARPTRGAKPRILTNSLAEPEDVAVARRRRQARPRDRRRPSRCASALGRELCPGAGVADDADLEADVRRRVELLYHPVGHLPDGRRRRRPSSTPSCACAASRACASSTRRSCR